MADHSDEWVLDSGCTYHMCPNKEWFSSFKELEGGVVFMGNDSACKTAGIGTIKLRNHDRVIEKLTDVRYVTNLKKKILSKEEVFFQYKLKQMLKQNCHMKF